MQTATSGPARPTDRCDRCSAAASLRAEFATGGVLHFCGHHARRYQDKLREQAAHLRPVA